MSILGIEARAFRLQLVRAVAIVGAVLLTSYFLFEGESGEVGQPRGEARSATKADLSSSPGNALSAKQVHAAIPAAVVASASPAAKANKLNFDSAEDLYALANTAVNSSVPMELYNGWLATRSCTRTPLERTHLENLVAQGGNDHSSIERVRNAKLILRRCSGFFNNDHAATLELERRFEYKIRTDPRFYFEGMLSEPPTDEQFSAILDRGDWYTFSVLMQTMTSRVALSAMRKSGAPDEVYFAMGWMQAACDLGQDCSSNGLSYANFCLAQSNCLGSWESFHIHGLTEAQKIQVSVHRNKIAQAFLQKDLKFFGIK